MDEQALNPVDISLRDIHLPEAISWWPPAPGWWILLVSILLVILVIFITRKILKKTYLSRHLKRDITTELEHIKQQFHTTQDESALAKSLSVLLRRASISYYPAKESAGLTGDNWLNWLDTVNISNTDKNFQSDIGRVLVTAPYVSYKNIDKSSDKSMTKSGRLNDNAEELINLCESWLCSSHKKQPLRTPDHNVIS